MTRELEPTADSLICQLKEVAERLGKNTVSRREFLRETGITDKKVLKHFDAWNDFVRAARLRAD